MRIAVNGQQAFGKAVLDALVERGEDVIAVYCAPDKEGAKPDPIKEAALGHGLPVYQPATFKEPSVWAEFKALEPDLGVMAYVIKLVPEEFLDAPTKGTIQYHPSLLPLHRGPSSINWPIIQGSAKTGLSIFWPDKGLDTGPILLQKEVEISPDDTLGSIYFDKLFPMGVAAMLEGVDMVRDGTAPKVVQDESKATYESWCKKEDVEIDWSQPVDKLHSLIRGANPQPGAWTVFEGATIQIFDCTALPDGGGAPGEIIAVSEDSITVAAGQGAIRILRLRPEGEGKIAAGEFAAAHGVAAGARLG